MDWGLGLCAGSSRTTGLSTGACSPSLPTSCLVTVDGVSALVGGMPGTGKTRCMAKIGVLVAGVGKRKVLFASLQNEPVRSMMISIEERLAESAPSFKSQFVTIPGVNELAKATLSMDIEGSPMKPNSYPGITFVAITYGKAENVA